MWLRYLFCIVLLSGCSIGPVKPPIDDRQCITQETYNQLRDGVFTAMQAGEDVSIGLFALKYSRACD